jgi:hypothetical protein
MKRFQWTYRMRNAYRFLGKLREMEEDRKKVLQEIKKTTKALRKIRGRRGGN